CELPDARAVCVDDEELGQDRAVRAGAADVEDELPAVGQPAADVGVLPAGLVVAELDDVAAVRLHRGDVRRRARVRVLVAVDRDPRPVWWWHVWGASVDERSLEPLGSMS